MKEIDIVLGGHDHLLIAWYDGRQAVMKAGSQGRHVGVLDLEIDRRKGRAGGTEAGLESELPSPFDLRHHGGCRGSPPRSGATRNVSTGTWGP